MTTLTERCCCWGCEGAKLAGLEVLGIRHGFFGSCCQAQRLSCVHLCLLVCFCPTHALHTFFLETLQLVLLLFMLLLDCLDTLLLNHRFLLLGLLLLQKTETALCQLALVLLEFKA